MTGSTNLNTQGSQAIRRALDILRLVANHPYPGATLTKVAQNIALKRSTAHRLLRYLVAEGLLNYDKLERTYSVGPTLFEIGLLHPLKYQSIIDSEMLQRVAFATGQTTYLMARIGSEAVCMLRADGHTEVRVTGVDVGQRRPLGVGAGAIALLSVLEIRQVEKFLSSLAPALRAYPGISPKLILSDVLEAKKRGFAVSPARVYPGVVGVGVILPSDPQPWLAVSITAPENYLTKFNPEKIARMIRSELGG